MFDLACNFVKSLSLLTDVSECTMARRLEPVTDLAAYNDGDSMADGEAKDSESELRSSPYSIL